MNRSCRLVGGLLAATVFLPLSQADVPVTFNLSVDPAGVALQFDVVSDDPLDALGFPEFVGTSDHAVRSRTVASGAHRFVVYSQSGDPISESGEVSVVFEPSLGARDGAISIDNITASNASGEVVNAAPNALPVLARPARDHQSLELGRPLVLHPVAYDLDGALQSVQLSSGSETLAAAQAAPFALSWTPPASGTFPLVLTATDDLDQQSVFELGNLRAYAASEITDFPAFASIHYGSETSSDAGFDADPMGQGLPNGLAYLLGLSPYAPDWKRLPVSRLERGEEGVNLVLEFVQAPQTPGVAWAARSSADLVDFVAVDGAQAVEVEGEDGSRHITLRIPLGDAPNGATFVNLEVSPEQ